jgi:DNA-binding PadR family transcriptional regulator
MAVLTHTERAVLDALRLRGRRERGGLGILDLTRVMAMPNGYQAIYSVLQNLEKAELIVSARVDDGTEPVEAQQRLYYLTKTAMSHER